MLTEQTKPFIERRGCRLNGQPNPFFLKGPRKLFRMDDIKLWKPIPIDKPWEGFPAMADKVDQRIRRRKLLESYGVQPPRSSSTSLK